MTQATLRALHRTRHWSKRVLVSQVGQFLPHASPVKCRLASKSQTGTEALYKQRLASRRHMAKCSGLGATLERMQGVLVIAD